MNAHKHASVSALLAFRANFLEIIAVAVIAGLGINLTATALVEQFKPDVWLVLGIGLLLTVLGCIYLLLKALPTADRHFSFEGVLTAKEGDKLSIIPIDRYEFSEQLATNIKALCAENKAIAKVLDAGICPDLDERIQTKAAGKPPATKLIEEAIEYFFLHQLSLHLSTYFENNEEITRHQIVRLCRRDIPNILLENHFLELFSKPMEDREPFMDHGDPPTEGRVVFAMGDGGAIFNSFELILPVGTKVVRSSNNSIQIRTKRFTLEVFARFDGYGAVLPDDFEELYMGVGFSDVSTFQINLDVVVSFNRRAFFSSDGWEYFRWIDSFLERLESEIAFDRFLQTVGWETAASTAIAVRNATKHRDDVAEQR